MSRVVITVIGKLVIAGLRLVGHNGSALPGLLIEKYYPGFVAKQLQQLPDGVVVISGTNGKTTTTKAVRQLLEGSGKRVLSNKSGSNFLRGVASAIIDEASWGGKLPFDIAVLELDEAYARRFVRYVKPNHTLVLNVMRDQLDRYGEIDTTASYLKEVVNATTKSVILNADDPRVAQLAGRGTTLWFGASPKVSKLLPNDDQLHLKESLKEHSLQQFDYELVEYNHGTMRVRAGKESSATVLLQMSGVHNAFNLLAAWALVRQIVPQLAPGELATIEPAFGRGEQIVIGDQVVTLCLVKNPGGFRQALRSFDQEHFDKTLILINDRFADGRDVSWLWDVDFSQAKLSKELLTGGLRGRDMALRLAYDDHRARTIDEIPVALDQLLEAEGKSSIIYCTYTALLTARKHLGTKTKLTGIWQ